MELSKRALMPSVDARLADLVARYAATDAIAGRVGYHLYLRAFQDGNGDGIGDLLGVTKRLPYLAALGITDLMLGPVHEYDRRGLDTVYAVTDYRAVATEFGGVDALRSLAAAARAHGIRPWADFVANHVSINHPWAQAVLANPDAPERDFFFIMTEEEALRRFGQKHNQFSDRYDRPWSPLPGSDGLVVLHSFFHDQWDLNFGNPVVRAAMADNLRWLFEMGISARLDACTFLGKEDGTDCESRPFTFELLREWRTIAGKYGTLLLGESCQPVDRWVQYLASGVLDTAYQFDWMGDVWLAFIAGDVRRLREGLERRPLTAGMSSTFLRNHDELTVATVDDADLGAFARTGSPMINGGLKARLAWLAGRDPQVIRALHATLLFSWGLPWIYQGDELGVVGDVSLDDRGASRTVMQWTDEPPHYGFSTAQRLGMPVGDHPGMANVTTLTGVRGMPLEDLRALIGLRQATPALRFGGREQLVDTGDGQADGRPIHAFVRTEEHTGDTVLVVINTSSSPALASLDLSEWRGRELEVLPGGPALGTVGDERFSLLVDRYGVWVIRLAHR